MILELSKDLIAKVKAAETAKEAGDSLEQGKAAMIQLFEDYAFAPLLKFLPCNGVSVASRLNELSARVGVLVTQLRQYK
jgi:hypothetical protein